MSDEAPSRSLILDLREERRAMREGQGFLEEKSLLLAAGIIRELQRYERLREAASAALAAARAALAAALASHGLEELCVLPAPGSDALRPVLGRDAVIGVTLLDARVEQPDDATAGLPWSSPEARAAMAAFMTLVANAVALGAAAGNLERLSNEYRRAIRRERALADVLIPAMDQRLLGLESRLEDLEREDAIGMLQGARRAARS